MMGLFVAIPSTRKPTTNNTQIWHDSTQFVFFLFPPRCCLWFLSVFFFGSPGATLISGEISELRFVDVSYCHIFSAIQFSGDDENRVFFCRTAFCTTRKIKTKSGRKNWGWWGERLTFFNGRPVGNHKQKIETFSLFPVCRSHRYF